MTDLILATVLIAVAAFRAWRIFALDTITEPARARMLKRSDQPLWHWISELVLCPWCLGFWFAGAGAALLASLYDWHLFEFILVWLASSGLTGLLGAENTGKHR